MANNLKKEDYGSMTLKQLIEELKLRGARLSGGKKELVDR